jgi:signal transduction histidine kinase
MTMPTLRIHGRTIADSARQQRLRERARLAQALHDEIGQSLTAVGIELDLLRMDASLEAPALASRVAAIQRSLETASTQLRRLSEEVEPEPAVKFGFRGALERLIERFRQRYQGQCNVALTHDIDPEGIAATALFETVEISLDNISEHSYASQVVLSTKTRNGALHVKIQDNGVGFEPRRTRAGYGFAVADELMKTCNTRMVLQSEPRRGTMIQLHGESKLPKAKKLTKKRDSAHHNADHRRVAG